ncbi:hypothetical protein EQG79_28960 [Spirosoma sordidisoli]|uniref:Uncharacterized protein n=1 Tax=Spirosoma sordidisoli TaxID=2502893 RepID=A0A4Q2UCN9_9BACT|nr:hypothetical protein EQG79_28960 [Spirosoma sordidisoli]
MKTRHGDGLDLRKAIETDWQGQLRVQNTLPKKPTRVMSNGVGLANILAKYQMVKQPTPTIQETDG